MKFRVWKKLTKSPSWFDVYLHTYLANVKTTWRFRLVEISSNFCGLLRKTWPFWKKNRWSKDSKFWIFIEWKVLGKWFLKFLTYLLSLNLKYLLRLPNPLKPTPKSINVKKSPTPKWVISACGSLLTHCLTHSKTGVLNVIQGILDVGNESSESNDVQRYAVIASVNI